ncbi:phage tail assembly protein [Mesorhizobium sp. M2A.F.Ca.ET.039.01.1.1]|uniref:phage tail assembly protein n=1 Tax=Mesorhizobium sp. M2A.F.Ca.ET.039.01.1.1 TaxID=2496746 RepID=UPI000FCC0FEC|nr:phage tail assembly protein [Mesorhizobium sp. M2A.F.Ca.ET.039.01.1.1]RWX72606.1 phage tail assembly protein [Mesorhizobium sp. M2A.F.Ca.ET.039.01.1.1]
MKLKYPIEVDGKTIDSLTFRRARAKDMLVLADHMAALTDIDPTKPEKAMSKGAIEATIAIVGTLSDIGEEAAGLLDFVDLIAASGEATASLGEVEGSDGEAQTGE